MASYNIKHIEYLRQKANLTYEQAVALLDRNDGDIGRALIELERAARCAARTSRALPRPGASLSLSRKPAKRASGTTPSICL